MSAFDLLKTSANSWYSGGTEERSTGGSEGLADHPETNPLLEMSSWKHSVPSSLQALAKATVSRKAI